MGCGESKAVSARRELYLHKFSPMFKSVKLSKSQIKQLFNFFIQVDADFSGQITVTEFLMFLDIERTKFALRAFSLLDADGSGEIDFGEFVIGVYMYCTHDKMSLISFGFDLYDLDGSGTLEMEEMENLVQEVYGPGYQTSRLALNILGKLEELSEKQSTINRDEFIAFAMKHPALLFPAFEMQTTIQRAVMGTRFWEKVANARYGDDPSRKAKLHDFLAQVKADALAAQPHLDTGAAAGLPPPKHKKRGARGTAGAGAGAGVARSGSRRKLGNAGTQRNRARKNSSSRAVHPGGMTRQGSNRSQITNEARAKVIKRHKERRGRP